MLNFYLVLSGLVLAGIGGSYSSASLEWVRILLGFALAPVTCVFWKLDERTKFLIKHARMTFAELECTLAFIHRGFFRERDWPAPIGLPSQSDFGRTVGSLRLVFRVTALAGIALAAQAAWSLLAARI